MDRKEAIDDFILGLHMSLKNATYFRGHPYLTKSAQYFKQKIDALHRFLNPIRINVLPESLFMDGKYFTKETPYVELAQLLHRRKIQGIEIKEGLNIEELVSFLNQLSLPAKEIFKLGGAEKIFSKEKSPHILAEEFDYSKLLDAHGDRYKDIWGYLFSEAVEEKDPQKLNEIVDYFGMVIDKFSAKDLFEKEPLINNFLYFLKSNHKEKFDRCVAQMFKAVLKYKNSLQDKDFKQIDALFKNLDNDDFAHLLWSGILKDDKFDILSFKFFYRISGETRDKDIASSLLNNVTLSESLKNSPQAIKNIQGLLSGSDRQFVSAAYQNTLSSLLKDISFKEGFSLDRNLLLRHYRFVLLSLLDKEINRERLDLILRSLFREWGKISEERDLGFLKCLTAVLKKRKLEDPSLCDVFNELDKGIFKFIVSLIWEETHLPGLDELVTTLETDYFGLNFYLEKIFTEQKVNPLGLKLFFKFYPSGLTIFYKNLEKKHSDIDFLARLIQGIKELNSRLALEVLIYIYSWANEFIKLEALRAMQQLSEYDEKFIFSILLREKVNLKKEALIILSKDPPNYKKAMELLLVIKSPCGIKNKLILENMAIIEEVGLEGAVDYLNRLRRRHFFWNKKIREKAGALLEKIHVRKD